MILLDEDVLLAAVATFSIAVVLVRLIRHSTLRRRSRRHGSRRRHGMRRAA
jgi:hypothetical protein